VRPAGRDRYLQEGGKNRKTPRLLFCILVIPLKT